MVLARVILGLLDLSPMTGYEVKRHCDTTIRYFWQADKAQIYRTLSQLTGDGLAAVETAPGVGGPARQVHHITDRGREVLNDWLTSRLDPQPERDVFLARLFFSGGLPEPELAELLATRRKTAESLLVELEDMRRSAPDPADRRARLRLATLDHGIAQVRTELDWLTEVEKELT
ncbi:PadR family transcriptional regulator [Prauserella flavalba]|uniref:PadR family transcriptional regulator n=1 Tax=Prauserella flavalba TaxID=1477506 RepID=A0A318LRK8_9PSEU|nr:PadR family transcriptional regulator [Prauserella flavalba]PXY33892.1 PadR family transcriptional regulator [Prauserella flavalba]